MDRTSLDSGLASDGTVSGGEGVSSTRVLLVDGHQDTLDLYRLAMEPAGFTVETATCCDEAWTLILTRPSVVVTEIVLPGMDGFHLIARMRGDARTQAIPIVLVTTYPARKLEQYAADMAIDAVLTKPCSPLDLIDAVRRATPGTRRERLDQLVPGSQAAIPAAEGWRRPARKISGE
ncbi:MAG TPA: response regulator [Vicinamibacterales bacterium]|jgi:CheY-like chemotaxis protein